MESLTWLTHFQLKFLWNDSRLVGVESDLDSDFEDITEPVVPQLRERHPEETQVLELGNTLETLAERFAKALPSLKVLAIDFATLNATTELRSRQHWEVVRDESGGHVLLAEGPSNGDFDIMDI